MKGMLTCLNSFYFILPPSSFILAFHGGKPHTFGDLWFTWGRDPLVIASLAVAGWLYFRGVRRVWRESGRGHGTSRGEAWAFAGGWLALFVALVSPLHPWGEVLFSAHMTQHEVLMVAAAPLLGLGRPLVALLWAVPTAWARALGEAAKAGWGRRVWAKLTNPLAAWALHALALWVWHVPALFEATLKSDLVHTL